VCLEPHLLAIPAGWVAMAGQHYHEKEKLG